MTCSVALSIEHERKILAGYDDVTITWVLSEHSSAEWLRKHRPEKKPELRRYMRLTAEEARRRNITLFACECDDGGHDRGRGVCMCGGMI